MHVPWEESFDPADDRQETPEGQFLTREGTEELRAAILQLPERQQKILEMAYWLEMNSTEIAEQLGMAPSSVRVALKQARDRLKKILQKK
jgi:RNA polymerase sigma-70 factor (ECF subfamily)